MRRSSRGFTLVEMTAVMALTAIVAGITAVFLRLPLQSYQDTARRVAIGDTADTAFSFLKRDLQTALPNSIRISSVGAVFYLELVQTRTGGRYRAEVPSAPVATSGSTCPDADADGYANDNVLAFGVAETCFSTIGPLAGFGAVVPGTDFVVVYNLGPGYSGADVYASGNVTGGNKSRITAIGAGAGGENVIGIESHTFALESPAHRFHVAAGPVTYVCDPAAQTLRRISGYNIAAAQPKPPAGTSVILAQGITGCSISYDQNVANQRNGIVSVWLRFADPAGSTTQSLFQQIQVSNDP